MYNSHFKYDCRDWSQVKISKRRKCVKNWISCVCLQCNRFAELTALLLNKRHEEIAKACNDFLTSNIFSHLKEWHYANGTECQKSPHKVNSNCQFSLTTRTEQKGPHISKSIKAPDAITTLIIASILMQHYFGWSFLELMKWSKEQSTFMVKMIFLTWKSNTKNPPILSMKRTGKENHGQFLNDTG